MVHSIELLFDDRTDAALRRLWQRLAEARLPGHARVCTPGSRPHVTLTVAELIRELQTLPMQHAEVRVQLPEEDEGERFDAPEVDDVRNMGGWVLIHTAF